MFNRNYDGPTKQKPNQSVTAPAQQILLRSWGSAPFDEWPWKEHFEEICVTKLKQKFHTWVQFSDLKNKEEK